MLLAGPPRSQNSVGFVKWFGGLNKRTGRENQFGFIEDIDGDDIFVHASQLGGVVPEEGDFAVFAVDAKDAEKKRAINVEICRSTEQFNTEALTEYLYDIEGFQKFLATSKYRDVLRSLVNRRDNDWAVDFLTEVLPISKAALHVVGVLISNPLVQTSLLQSLSFDELEALDDTFKYVPMRYFDEQSSQALTWLVAKSQSARDLFFKHKINDLSTGFVLASAFEGLIENPDVFDGHAEEIKLFVGQAFQKQFRRSHAVADRIVLPDYAQSIFKRRFDSFEDLTTCPALAPFFELPLIKQKALSRDRSFVDDVERSVWLAGDPEAFFLRNLLPLIWDGNDDSTIEAVFFHEVWEALLKGKLSVDHSGFQKLFPSCRVLGPRLSCEATFWQKEELFLCRGRRCDDPQVIPDLSKNFLDFNAYDWLEYFGRSYANASQPSRKDFPIKLAGYFNRLRELREVLDCRHCGNLMKPDFKYSRVEVKAYDPETQSYVKKQFFAAYRVTVFYCDNPNCAEKGVRHYLNHCLGQKCNKIIDSRDLSKCENGFYRCTCGSCCREHQIIAEQRKHEMEQRFRVISSRRWRR